MAKKALLTKTKKICKQWTPGWWKIHSLNASLNLCNYYLCEISYFIVYIFVWGSGYLQLNYCDRVRIYCLWVLHYSTSFWEVIY